MASGTTVAPGINGTVSQIADTEYAYAEFYEKLFTFEDRWRAGETRFECPPPFNNQSRQHRAQDVGFPSTNPTPNAPVNGIASEQRAEAPVAFVRKTPFVKPSTPPPPSPAAPKPTSGFDPVLVEKSDVLIKAELKLQRQRIERALKDQVDARKGYRDQLESGMESTLDVDDILAKAHQRVAPISVLRPKAARKGSPSTSFDENDYYSSQANSWSTEGSEAEAPAAVQVDVSRDVIMQDQGASTKPGIVDQLGSSKQTIPSQSLNTPPGLMAAAPEASTDGPSAGAPLNANNALYNGDALAGEGEEGEEREESYSPPAPDAFAGETNDIASDREPSVFDNRASQQSAVQELGALQPGLTAVQRGDGTVVRNQVDSLVAPQPARISPLLARGKERRDRAQKGPGSPRVENGRPQDQYPAPRGGRRSPNRSGRQSPAGPRQQINNPRKRRRENNASDDNRRGHGKRVARTPEPVAEPQIKEEPISPPPFGGLVDSARRKVYRPLPDDIEIISPREARSRPVFYNEREPLPASHRYVVEKAPSPGYARAPSRTAYRVIERDDQDLRRVASLQYARRPHSPGPAPMAEPRTMRAASHAYIERPVVEPPLYRAESVRPAPSRYVRERSRSPPHVIEPYPARPHTPSAMVPPPPPPPPRRTIVVDQYGNEYITTSSADVRPSVGPPLRRAEPEGYYEHAVAREPIVRASVRPGPYEEEDIQRMPPPPPRRYAEQPEVEFIDQRPYRPREYSLRPAEVPREELAPVRDPDPRRPYEEMPPPPREYVTRSYSVRPEVERREPVEYVSRHVSVAPGAEYIRRAEPAPREYRDGDVIMEDRGFRYAPQPYRRYVDEAGPGERPVEVVRDPYEGEVRRVSYRY